MTIKPTHELYLERTAFDEYQLTGKETESERLYIGRFHSRTEPIRQAVAKVIGAADKLLRVDKGIELHDALVDLRKILEGKG